VPTRRSYVLTSRGVHAVVQSPASARTGGSPSGIVTPSLVRYGGWRTTASNRFFTAGSKSFGTANPPIVTQQSAYVVAFFVVVGLIAGVLAVGFATSNGAKIGAATGIPRTAVTSTTSVSGGGGSNAGQATTSLSRSAQGAVVDAKKFVDAIDQRVVGLYHPPGSYRVLDSSFPWVVQFSSADPDRSSGQPVWTIRNVQQEAGGAFQELAPTTVTAEHLNGLTGDWGSGLDAVVQAVPTNELTGMRLLCDPNGTTCVWQVAADPGPRYFAANGARLTGPPAWVTGT
jgi:hypothetical protein